MNPPTLLRPPLVWLVVAELTVVALLGGVTWHVWQEHVGPSSGGAAPQVAGPVPSLLRPPAAAAASPASSPPPAGTPKPGPTPGVRTDADFLSHQLDELNRVEASFADLEWKVTSAVADAIQRYIDGVVLPAIDHAEGPRS